MNCYDRLMFGLVTGEWVLKQQISDGGMPLHRWICMGGWIWYITMDRWINFTKKKEKWNVFRSFFIPSPLNFDEKILIGHNHVRNTCTHENGTDLYRFTCFTCWIYFSKLKVYLHLVPFNMITRYPLMIWRHKKRQQEWIWPISPKISIQSNLITRNQETVNPFRWNINMY